MIKETDAGKQWYTYTFKAGSNTENLYFAVDTYMAGIVHTTCTKGAYAAGNEALALSSPLIWMQIFKKGENTYKEQFYS